jgi:cell division protein FtsL
MRRSGFWAVALAIGAAFALYSVKHDTRLIELRVQTQERRLEKIQSDIAVLQAERAWLARPERIDQMARGMGLRPIAESQYSGIENPNDDGISELLRGVDPAPR